MTDKKPDTQIVFMQSFDAIQGVVHAIAVSKGWHETPCNDGEVLALIHSEVSEALEALRTGNKGSKKIQGFSQLEEELADIIIRVMDYAGANKLRVAEAIIAKAAYNTGRDHKHGKLF